MHDGTVYSDSLWFCNVTYLSVDRQITCLSKHGWGYNTIMQTSRSTQERTGLDSIRSKWECFVYTLHSFNSSCASQMRSVSLTTDGNLRCPTFNTFKADMTHCLHKILNISGKPKQLKSHSIIKRKDWIHTIIVRACFWKCCLNSARSSVIAYSKSQIIKECSGISTSSVDGDIVDNHRKRSTKK